MQISENHNKNKNYVETGAAHRNRAADATKPKDAQKNAASAPIIDATPPSAAAPVKSPTSPQTRNAASAAARSLSGTAFTAAADGAEPSRHDPQACSAMAHATAS